jgi:hypothetical protein
MACAVCRRDEKAVNGPGRECAHVDCPHRRPVTAATPDRAQGAGAPGCFRVPPLQRSSHDKP